MSEKRHFIKNSLFSYLSKFVPIGFSFIYTLILANSLGQANYGLFIYATAFAIGFVKLFGSNLLGELLMHFSAQTNSIRIFKKVFLAEYAISILITIALIFFGQDFMSGIEGGSFDILLFSALILLLYPLSSTFFSLNRGIRNFKNIFLATIAENIVNLGGIIFFVSIMNLGIYGAFYAKFISLIVIGITYIYFFKKTKFNNDKLNNKAVIHYGVFGSFGEFLKQGLSQSELIVAGMFISPAILGVFYIGEKIVTIMLNGLTNAVSDVLFPMNSSNYKDKQKIERHSSLCLKGTIIVVFFASIILLLIAEPFLKIFFPGYLPALELIPLLIIREYIGAIGLVKTILNSINKIGQRTIQRAITIAFGIPALFILVPAFGIKGFIIAQTITELVAIIIAYFMLWKLNGIKISIIPSKNDLVYFKDELTQIFKDIIQRKRI